MQLRAPTTLQSAYDASADPELVLAASPGGLSIRDASTPIGGDLLAVENNAGANFFAVQAGELNVGFGTQRLARHYYGTLPGERGGIALLPDDFTQTIQPTITYALQWNSTVISNVAGGAPFGNDTAPAMVGAIGEARFDDPGNVFSSSLLFNQATTVTANGVNVGPIYTMVNQPTMRTGTLGGSRSVTQHNAVRAQARIGPNLAGNITQGSIEYFFATVTVDATVGTATVTTCNYFAPKAPTLTAGGTIGTLNVLDIPNIPGAGITTLRGINSAMASGTFINHTGAAPSFFNAALSFGTDGGDRVELSRPFAGVLRMLGQGGANNEGLDWDFQNANNVAVTTSTSAGLNIDLSEIAFGPSTVADGTNNWVFAFSPGLRATQLAGDYSEVLFTSSSSISIAHAISTFATWTVNAASMTLGAGSVTNACNVLIQTNVNQGSNDRSGLRITSNPSGGAGVNAALHVTAGLSRFDGRVDVNNGIALGGGAAATLGTIGGTGPTAAAQAQWLEIDIAGTPHWIAVWT